MRKPGKASKRPPVLSWDACPSCGTTMKSRLGAFRERVNGEEIRVPSIPHLRCPECREVMFDLVDAQRLHGKAVEMYRRKHELLSAAEIRAIRERHGLTQAELARLLRLGGNSISRWESGRNVQNAAMDLLLRLVRDLPGSIAYLRESAPET